MMTGAVAVVLEILVCANGPGLLESRLRIARRIADRFEAHVEAVFFREALNPATVPSMAPGFTYLPQQRAAAQSAWDEETAQAEHAKDAFDRWMAPNEAGPVTSPPAAGPRTATWSQIMGKAAHRLPSRARASDLIVAGGPGEGASTLDDEISSLALLSSGRMVIFAPRPGHLEDDILRSVLIAWDDDAAVTRAIAQAMPLIAAAGEVTLFIGEPSPETVTPCDEILSYLGRKGVHAGTIRCVPTVHTLRHALVEKAQEVKASLIIMGAYKHSRSREMLLGGTTRYVIHHAGCAVLMVD